MINEYTDYIVTNYLDFSMIAIPAQVECLIFDETFTGELPALYDFINLKKLVINVPISWTYVSQLDLDSLNHLSFVIDDSAPICRIDNFMLEHLEIYNISQKNLTPIEKIISSNILTGYDFSGLPNLKSLSLDYFLGFDFNKTKLPKALESLKITNSEIKNVDWCLTVKNLKKINLDYNAIRDIKLLSYMPNLQQLSLQNNDIEEAEALSDIDSLKYLNLLNNPIKEEQKLREDLKIETLLINQKDYEINMLKNTAGKLKTMTEEFLYHYDRFITNRSNYLQMQNLKEKAKGEDIRLRSYYQLSFEHHLDKINPFNYEYSHYTSEYKKLFMEFAKKSNPELIIKDRLNQKLYKEIEFEKKGLNTIYNSKTGALFLVNHIGIYRIEVKKTIGSGKLYFNENSVNERLKNILIRSTILTLCKTEQKDLAVSFDYDITIESIYGSKIDSSISLGIIIGIFSLLNEISIKSNTAIYAQLNTRGSLKKIEINKNILPLLDKIGIEHLIIGKTTQKALNIISDTMDLTMKLHCCNDVNKVLTYLGH